MRGKREKTRPAINLRSYSETPVLVDTLTKQREHQERHKKLAESFRSGIFAHPALADHHQKLSEMTLAEYELYEKQTEEEWKNHIAEYARNNPLQESIVNRIYEKAETIEPDYTMTFSYTCFLMSLHPLEFMSHQDFDNELYESFLRHAHELTAQRYKP
jgi:hypothetical protein